MKFEIDVKKFKIPKSVAEDINKTSSDKKNAKDKQLKTLIFVGLCTKKG
jgi:hypothetical protein